MKGKAIRGDSTDWNQAAFMIFRVDGINEEVK